VKLRFLSGLREIVGGEEVDLAYVGRLSELLESLCDRHGESLRRLLLDTENPGRKSPFVKILVDGEDVGQGDPELGGEEEIFLFLPIAGG
jgi:molybdopterin converting factor small subunit